MGGAGLRILNEPPTTASITEPPLVLARDVFGYAENCRYFAPRAPVGAKPGDLGLYIQRFRPPKRDSCAHQPDRIQVMRAWAGRLFGKRVAPTLRLALRSYLNNPVTLLVSLALIIATSFLKCIVWGCDLGMQSGWVFVGEFIAPGLAAGFLATFVWHWWQSGN